MEAGFHGFTVIDDTFLCYSYFKIDFIIEKKLTTENKKNKKGRSRYSTPRERESNCGPRKR
jgi:hypothetical protein